MIGERENSHTNYGKLIMRAFDIHGNDINAFYDTGDNLIFVLDNTINSQKPNVLLVINPDGDKKWDEILSSDYNVDLETIRPKVDNKYQKLDIEYSGLNVYENLITAYNAGDSLDDYLNDLAILRDSAARHSAMMRLNMANEIISKTNATIVKTKESIVRLEARIKTLRSKLSAAKKEIGKVNTKQSASKILKLESQIEAAHEKLKRAKKRLESAQKRLENATVDAELASDLLNQPSTEIKQSQKNKPIAVAPEYPVQTVPAADEEDEDDDDEEIEADSIKPLFNEDPQILNDDIAFKPISFDAPTFNEVEETVNEAPVLNQDMLMQHDESETKPVLESLAPVEPEPVFAPKPVMEEKTEIIEEKPVLETMKPVEEIPETIVQPAPVAPVVEPVAPIVNNFQTPIEAKSENSKPGFIYYVLLFILILLSVFTLWLYQKNMATDATPVLAAKTSETHVVEPKPVATEPVAIAEEDTSVFLDEEPAAAESVSVKPVSEPEPVVEIEEEVDEEPIAEPEPIVEPEPVIEEAPAVMDVVPAQLNTSGIAEEEDALASEEEILAQKPIYEPGSKYDAMFVDEQGVAPVEYDEQDVIYYDDGDEFFDAEEAEYQNENY